MFDIQSTIMTIPEAMINKYGNYDHCATFIHVQTDATYLLPHYNLKVDKYNEEYKRSLSMLMNTNLDFDILHVSESKNGNSITDNKDKYISTINNLLFNKQDDRITFYIRPYVGGGEKRIIK